MQDAPRHPRTDAHHKFYLAIMEPFLPGVARPATKGDREGDFRGIPTKYYDNGSASERSGGVSPRLHVWHHLLKLLGGALLAVFAGRTDLIGAVILTLHSAGLTPPGLLSAAHGHASLVVLFLVLSFLGAGYGYYAHCSAIEAWCDAQPKGSEAEWKIQPAAVASADSRGLARRLGTFNAACAAVYGTASSLAALRGGLGVKLYFDICEHGLLYYLFTWPLFFCYVEAFAYTLHRCFHHKILYKHFHKLHHRFQPPTAFSAVAFHPFEFACYVFGGQLIFFVVPIHPTVMTVVGFYTASHLVEDHTGIKNTSPWPWQPTTSFHDDHHKHFHVNFGQHVLWFDQIFGTLRLVHRTYGEDAFMDGGGGSVPAAGVARPMGAKAE